MKKFGIFCGLLAFNGLVLAGVVYEIETKDHGGTHTTEVSVEGKNLKMGIAPGKRGAEGTMIFRGDRREMVVVDHDSKSYMVMDEESFAGVADQISQAMSKMQEALKNVPEGQRDMVEKMMKDRMPAAQSQPKGPSTEVKKTRDRKKINSYPCIKYDVLRDGRKIRELWVTDWKNVEGSDDVANVFGEMASFFEGLMQSLESLTGGANFSDGLSENIFAQMKALNGFPVVTKDFADDGSLEGESTLRSSKRRTLDPADFEPPAGYKRRSMMGR